MLMLFTFAIMPALQDRPSPASDAPCIAIVLPSVEGVENSTTVAMSVRALFQSYLTGPSLQSVMRGRGWSCGRPSSMACPDSMSFNDDWALRDRR